MPPSWHAAHKTAVSQRTCTRKPCLDCRSQWWPCQSVGHNTSWNPVHTSSWRPTTDCLGRVRSEFNIVITCLRSQTCVYRTHVCLRWSLHPATTLHRAMAYRELLKGGTWHHIMLYIPHIRQRTCDNLSAAGCCLAQEVATANFKVLPHYQVAPGSTVPLACQKLCKDTAPSDARTKCRANLPMVGSTSCIGHSREVA